MLRGPRSRRTSRHHQEPLTHFRSTAVMSQHPVSSAESSAAPQAPDSTYRIRAWIHRVIILMLFVTASLVTITLVPVTLGTQEALTAHPLIRRALRQAGFIPMSVWGEEDARRAMGFDVPGSSMSEHGSQDTTRGRREVAIVMSNTKLRRDRDTDSPSLRTLPKGTVLLVMRSDENSLLVAHSDEGRLEFGWIEKDHVKRFP